MTGNECVSAAFYRAGTLRHMKRHIVVEMEALSSPGRVLSYASFIKIINRPGVAGAVLQTPP